MVEVVAEECTSCGICADVCPVEAISLDGGVALIDQDECTQCLVCLDECPVEAISEG